MSRNNILSLGILAAIVMYFVLIWPKRPETLPVQGGQSPSEERVVPSGATEVATAPVTGCNGRVTEAGLAAGEVRFVYEGTAEKAWVRWPGGGVEARVEDACYGGECRFTLPRPALSGVQVGIDGCAPLELP